MVARRLARERNEVVIVEQRLDRCELLDESLDAKIVQGNASSIRTLEQAGIREAEMLIAVTSSDEANISRVPDRSTALQRQDQGGAPPDPRGLSLEGDLRQLSLERGSGHQPRPGDGGAHSSRDRTAGHLRRVGVRRRPGAALRDEHRAGQLGGGEEHGRTGSELPAQELFDGDHLPRTADLHSEGRRQTSGWRPRLHRGACRGDGVGLPVHGSPTSEEGGAGLHRGRQTTGGRSGPPVGAAGGPGQALREGFGWSWWWPHG